ncbi:BRO domain-containing protein [Paucilactobacillus oligofermentans DSM 15707 = LMG 22743]|uniref:BRO domain-containing protein n=1 Tax=Paucilactobacillus oligofermentans DSM 15707 = LMG 22743 TaxID=1423778 RepID=A0A0R1RL73_9LACO|nr:ORF6C domain-containing protein [Paucilactobacillus oligofermentans]KRL55908.1 BRO domain-containing protein [Paucilactobacillus oligofermentans DSM 15707 = LMG 22743]CUS26112.1 Prophage antirepressor protein [Paucilactobacillus oligofermentans DSM 15707 = LMG 22743]
MELQKFSNGVVNLPIKKLEDGSIEFDAEQAAIGLGIVSSAKGYTNVRWSRINEYLNSATTGRKISNDEYLNSATTGRKISKGDFITEPQFYKLAIKANNETAEQFQDWVTGEVLPSIRKNGNYQVKPLSPIEQIRLQNDALIDIDDRVTDLEENQTLSPGEYNYISKRVGQSVNNFVKDRGLDITSDQRKLLYKDINRGINEVTNIKTRAQLRKRHFDLVTEFIDSWNPSTATMMAIRQTNLDL